MRKELGYSDQNLDMYNIYRHLKLGAIISTLIIIFQVRFNHLI